MKYFLLLLFFCSSISVSAQISFEKSTEDTNLKLAALPYYSYGKGLGITAPDSIFQVNMRFRMQNRASYYDVDGDSNYIDAQIRRLRLRFDGFIGNPKFLYAIQLSFAPGDVGEIKDGENLNIIRDAVIYYRPTKKWNFAFGQTKLPGNRQRINSSGALQLTDRSINNAKFTIDRDFGFQAHYLNESKDKFSYNLKAAVSTGEGRNATGGENDGVAVTGKAEIFPFGAFAKNGSTFEGDLMREQTPKVLLSGAFQQNNHALRTQGQLGADLFETRTIQSVFVDAMIKYQGWSAMSAYMSRGTSKDAITQNPADATDFNYVFAGNGFDYQLSYIFENDYEIAGRYSLQNVHKDIEQLAPQTKQFSLGVTKYIWEHTFKVQTEVTYDMLDYYDGSSKNNWYLRFQVEIGI